MSLIESVKIAQQLPLQLETCISLQALPETLYTLEGETTLTEYEKLVADAIMLVWTEAQRHNKAAVFTLETLFQMMPGGNTPVTISQKKAIERTLERLGTVFLAQDTYTALQQAELLEHTADIKSNPAIVHLQKHTILKSNNRIAAIWFEILSKPLLLSYGEMTQQLQYAPVTCYLIKKVIQGQPMKPFRTLSKNRQVIIKLLTQKAIALKQDNLSEQNSLIWIADLMTALGLPKNSRAKAYDVQEFSLQVLEYLIVCEILTGYNLHKVGHKIVGMQMLI